MGAAWAPEGRPTKLRRARQGGQLRRPPAPRSGRKAKKRRGKREDKGSSLSAADSGRLGLVGADPQSGCSALPGPLGAGAAINGGAPRGQDGARGDQSIRRRDWAARAVCSPASEVGSAERAALLSEKPRAGSPSPKSHGGWGAPVPRCLPPSPLLFPRQKGRW